MQRKHFKQARQKNTFSQRLSQNTLSRLQSKREAKRSIQTAIEIKREALHQKELRQCIYSYNAPTTSNAHNLLMTISLLTTLTAVAARTLDHDDILSPDQERGFTPSHHDVAVPSASTHSILTPVHSELTPKIVEQSSVVHAKDRAVNTGSQATEETPYRLETRKESSVDKFIQIAKKGDLKGLKKMLENENSKKLVNSPDVIANAFFWAANENHLPVVEYLFQEKYINGTEKDKNNNNVLHAMAKSKTAGLQVAKYLVEVVGVNLWFENHNSQTPLTVAKLHSNIELAKYFDDAINLRDRLGSFVQEGKLYLAKNLIAENDIDISTFHYYEKKYNLLHIAVVKDQVDVLEYLIEAEYADVSAVNTDGNTVLHIAADEGSEKSIRYLIENTSIDLMEKNVYGQTALDIAKNKKHTAIVELLRQTLVQRETVDGYDKFLAAKENNRIMIIEIKNTLSHLIDSQVSNEQIKVYAEKNHYLFASVAHDTGLELTKYFVDELGMSTLVRDHDLPIFNAIQMGSLENFKYLMKKPGAELRDRTGHSQICVAVQYSHMSIVQYLIEEIGANLEEECEPQLSILGVSILDNNIQMVKYLVEKAKVRAEAAILFAFHSDNIDILRYLIRYDQAYVTSTLPTFLKAAEKANAKKCIQFLKFKLHQQQIKDTPKKPPVHESNLSNSNKALIAIAVAALSVIIGRRKQLWPVVSFPAVKSKPQKTLHSAAKIEGEIESLLKGAINKTQLNTMEKGLTPVHIAAQEGCLRNLEQLVRVGADLSVLTLPKKQSILHLAAKNGHVHIIKFLMTQKELENHFNLPDALGNTWLHLAARNNHKDAIIEMLKNHKIDISAFNNQGKTAYELTNDKYIQDLIRPKKEVEEKKPEPEIKSPVTVTVSPFEIWQKKVNESEYFSCQLQAAGSNTKPTELHLFFKKDSPASGKSKNALIWLIEQIHERVAKKSLCTKEDFRLDGVHIVFSNSDHFKAIPIDILNYWYEKVADNPKITEEAVARFTREEKSESKLSSLSAAADSKSMHPTVSDRNADASVTTREDKKEDKTTVEVKNSPPKKSDSPAKEEKTLSATAATKQTHGFEIVLRASAQFKPVEPSSIQQLLLPSAADAKNDKPELMGAGKAEQLDSAFFHLACIKYNYYFLEGEIKETKLDHDVIDAIKHYCLAYHLTRSFVMLKGCLPEQKELAEDMRGMVAHYMIDISENRELISACARDLANKKLDERALNYFYLKHREKLKSHIAEMKNNEEELVISRTKLYMALYPLVSKKTKNEMKQSEAIAKIVTFLNKIKQITARIVKDYTQGDSNSWLYHAAQLENEDVIKTKHVARIDASSFLFMLIGEIARFAIKKENNALASKILSSKISSDNKRKCLLSLEKKDEFDYFLVRCILLRNSVVHGETTELTNILAMIKQACDQAGMRSHVARTSAAAQSASGASVGVSSSFFAVSGHSVAESKADPKQSHGVIS